MRLNYLYVISMKEDPEKKWLVGIGTALADLWKAAGLPLLWRAKHRLLAIGGAFVWSHFALFFDQERVVSPQLAPPYRVGAALSALASASRRSCHKVHCPIAAPMRRKLVKKKMVLTNPLPALFPEQTVGKGRRATCFPR
jgi:hypothetical protein